MKTHYLAVQISDRLREIWELTLFQKGVTPGDSPKIWEKSRLLRLRLQESVQPYFIFDIWIWREKELTRLSRLSNVVPRSSSESNSVMSWKRGKRVCSYMCVSLATLEIEAYFEKFYFLCDLKYRGACFPAADQGLKRSKGRLGQFHVLHGFRETRW